MERQVEGEAGRLAPRREDLAQLVRRYDLELRERAVPWALVGPPAPELRRVSEATALHVIVRHLDHELGAQRFPRQILALAPAADCSGPTMHRRLLIRWGLGPGAPRMALERVLAIRFEKRYQLPTFGGGEARADADVLEVAVV